MKRILVVEDEAMIRGELARFLRRHAWDVTEAGSVDEALGISTTPQSFDAVLADVRLPGRQGTELVGHVGRAPVLLMTSYATVRGAVRSMQLGAVDYLSKPFDLDELLVALERISSGSGKTKAEPPPSVESFGILGDSAPILALRTRVKKLAPSEATVLVLGSSGTGKELVARGLHRASPRSNGPFVAVNCAAIPENLVESELFGHQKGAFTGAITTRQGLVQSAEGGTLFLDEIGELPANVQARLLRFLQTGEVRVVGTSRTQVVKTRLVAATHRDLAAEVKQGTFRDDLYFRLRVLEIRVPTLSERGPADILLLARAFLRPASQRAGVDTPVLSAAAEENLVTHTWPGHVRELENAIERAVVWAENGVIEPEHLALDDLGDVMTETSTTTVTTTPTPTPSESSSTDLSLGEYFKKSVIEHQANLTETELAKRLGVSRKTLWERRQRLGLPRTR